MVRLRHHLTGGGWRSETFLKTFTCLLLLGGLTAASGFKSADKTSPNGQSENASIVPTPETSSISKPPLQNYGRSKRSLDDLPFSDVYSSDKDLGSLQKGVKKITSKAQGTYIIPYMRPGRSMYSELTRGIDTTNVDFTLDLKNKRNYTIPLPRFGKRSSQRQTSLIPYMNVDRSEDIYDEFDSDRDLKVKKSGTIIPLARFGRDNNNIYDSKSDLNNEKENIDDIWGDENDSKDTIDDDNGLNSEIEILDSFPTPSLSSKTDLNKSMKILKKTIIPQPRLGRALDKNNVRTKQIEKRSMASMKRQSTDLLLPQIRYGRSVDLALDRYPNKNRQSESEKSQDFILPYPRPGRSTKSSSSGSKMSHAKNGNILIPYPRPGRSNRNLEIVSEVHVEKNSNEKRQGYMVPSARLGRSDNTKELGSFRDTEMVKQMLDQENQLLLKVQPKDKNEINDTEESAGIFLIPYPRPGKRQESTEASFEERKLFNDDDKIQAEDNNAKEVLPPYPRPGKKDMVSDKEYLSDQDLKRADHRTFENESTNDLQGNEKEAGINEEIVKASEDTEESNRESVKGIYLVPYLRFGRSNTLVPYPRFGRSNALVPYPRLGRTSDANFMLPYARLGKKSYDDFIPNPRLDLSRSDSRNQYILPHPRAGRELHAAFMLPYPRLGKKSYEEVIPYARLGRSDTDKEQQYVLPYPRLGRSPNSQSHSNQGDKGKYILPLPRLGRSEDSGIMLPYPRPGRAETSDIMLPYPRPGRSEISDIMLPYPRPGRSENSGIMPPYPRIGRSKNSDIMLPYPRPGRSKAPGIMIPYPRPGRSEKPGIMIPYPRPGRSEKPDILIPYPRPGRSGNPNIMLPYPRPGRAYNQSNNTYLTPYPRLGRSEILRDLLPPNYNIRAIFNDSLIPQPRLGRSNHASSYVVPYPRLGRSEDRKSVIPQPRIGRANPDYNIPSRNEMYENEMNDLTYSKEDALFLSDESMLSETTTEKYGIMPYPRVGRSEKRNDQTYIVPYPRLGRSKTNSTVKNKQNYSKSLIPYPRFGRAELEPEKSSDLRNYVHKLNKHMLTGNSNYILPYPRPGRFVK